MVIHAACRLLISAWSECSVWAHLLGVSSCCRRKLECCCDGGYGTNLSTSSSNLSATLSSSVVCRLCDNCCFFNAISHTVSKSYRSCHIAFHHLKTFPTAGDRLSCIHLFLQAVPADTSSRDSETFQTIEPKTVQRTSSPIIRKPSRSLRTIRPPVFAIATLFPAFYESVCNNNVPSRG